MDGQGVEASWPEVMEDLGQVQAVHLTLPEGPYRVRADFHATGHSTFLAAGVRPPPRVSRTAAA